MAISEFKILIKLFNVLLIEKTFVWEELIQIYSAERVVPVMVAKNVSKIMEKRLKVALTVI